MQVVIDAMHEIERRAAASLRVAWLVKISRDPLDFAYCVDCLVLFIIVNRIVEARREPLPPQFAHRSKLSNFRLSGKWVTRREHPGPSRPGLIEARDGRRRRELLRGPHPGPSRPGLIEAAAFTPALSVKNTASGAFAPRPH